MMAFPTMGPVKPSLSSHKFNIDTGVPQTAGMAGRVAIVEHRSSSSRQGVPYAGSGVPPTGTLGTGLGRTGPPVAGNHPEWMDNVRGKPGDDDTRSDR